MKVITYYFFAICLFSGSFLSKIDAQPPNSIPLFPATPSVVLSQIPPISLPGNNTPTATFIVNYIDGNAPDLTWTQDKKDAFDFAAALCAQLIDSSVPITIDAYLKNSSGDNSLATTEPYFTANFLNAPQSDVQYPCALANKYAGFDVRGDVPDMKITVSSDQHLQNNLSETGSWYLGIDGNATPYQEYDFVTSILHEIAHGLLGYSVVLWEYNTSGQPEATFLDPNYPFIVDQFLGNCGTGQLFSDMALPSQNFGYAITNIPIVSSQGNIFYNYTCWLGTSLDTPCNFDSTFDFDNPNSSTNPPRINTSGVLSGDLFVSHLDEETYGTGNPNSLMSPFQSMGENIHSPGSIFLCMLSQIGWDIDPSIFLSQEDGESIDDFVPRKSIYKEEFTLNPNSHEIYTNNPVANSLQIRISSRIDKGNIEILNLSGKTLIEKEITNTKQTSIDCSFLAPGTYLIKTSTNENISIASKLFSVIR